MLDLKGVFSALIAFLTVSGSASKVPRSVGAIAQLGERLHGMQEVGGSIPPSSTSSFRK